MMALGPKWYDYFLDFFRNLFSSSRAAKLAVRPRVQVAQKTDTGPIPPSTPTGAIGGTSQPTEPPAKPSVPPVPARPVPAPAATVSRRTAFLRNPPVEIASLRLHDAAPHKFSTESVGWSWDGGVILHGHSCRVAIHVTVNGSKQWEPNKRKAWLAAARPLSVAAVNAQAKVKEFSSGNVGWHVNSGMVIRGESVTVNANFTVSKSKEWPST